MKKRITIDYTLYDDNNEELDSSTGLGPISFVTGDKKVLPAVEFALLQATPGETLSLKLAPKDAFGDVKTSAFRTIARTDLPADAQQAGAIIGIPDDNGETHQVRVTEITDTEAVLDFNHPLAGKAIRFDINVIDVEHLG